MDSALGPWALLSHSHLNFNLIENQINGWPYFNPDDKNSSGRGNYKELNPVLDLMS